MYYTLLFAIVRTPHESLPVPQRAFRQFFRLVTANVSLWYKDHSTANPLGVKPDPRTTHVVVGDKFSTEGVEILKVTGALGRRSKEEERQVEE